MFNGTGYGTGLSRKRLSLYGRQPYHTVCMVMKTRALLTPTATVPLESQAHAHSSSFFMHTAVSFSQITSSCLFLGWLISFTLPAVIHSQVTSCPGPFRPRGPQPFLVALKLQVAIIHSLILDIALTSSASSKQ